MMSNSLTETPKFWVSSAILVMSYEQSQGCIIFIEMVPIYNTQIAIIDKQGLCCLHLRLNITWRASLVQSMVNPMFDINIMQREARENMRTAYTIQSILASLDYMVGSYFMRQFFMSCTSPKWFLLGVNIIDIIIIHTCRQRIGIPPDMSLSIILWNIVGSHPSRWLARPTTNSLTAFLREAIYPLTVWLSTKLLQWSIATSGSSRNYRFYYQERQRAGRMIPLTIFYCYFQKKLQKLWNGSSDRRKATILFTASFSPCADSIQSMA